MSAKPLTMAVVGAGGRGTYSYAPFALHFPDQLQITAVAEPNEFRRKRFAEMYNIPEENQFTGWEDLFENHKADAVVIANDDAGHYGPIKIAMEQGWHILAEKPITNDLNELLEMKDKILSYDKIFMICHVLRFTSFFKTLKEILDSGKIGELVSVQHNENVGHFHQAHSFVRGNWRNKEESSPMILAKCCHDMDIINYMIGKDCLRLASFGSLKHFRKDKAPEGATERCFDGCPHLFTCPYSTARYFENNKERYIPTYARIVKGHAGTDDLKEALRMSDFGRCVYHSNNNVVDHQVVSMEYEDEITVAFTMCGLTDLCDRTMKYMGSKGEIQAHMERNEIVTIDFKTGDKTINKISTDINGHSGGDSGTIIEFVKLMQNNDYKAIRENNKQGIQAHLMSFAAEQSRLEKSIVELDSFEK